MIGVAVLKLEVFEFFCVVHAWKFYSRAQNLTPKIYRNIVHKVTPQKGTSLYWITSYKLSIIQIGRAVLQ